MEAKYMKKLVIVLLILIVPMAVYAKSDFRIGPTVYLNHPIIQDSTVDPVGLDISDFSFGADLRLKLFIFHIQGMALFTPAAATLSIPASTDIFLDAGFAFDVLFLRLGLGVGPNFSIYFGQPNNLDPLSMGANAKATLDLRFKRISIGVNYLVQFDFDLDNPSGSILSADKTQGLFGIDFLIKLGKK